MYLIILPVEIFWVSGPLRFNQNGQSNIVPEIVLQIFFMPCTNANISMVLSTMWRNCGKKPCKTWNNKACCLLTLLRHASLPCHTTPTARRATGEACCRGREETQLLAALWAPLVKPTAAPPVKPTTGEGKRGGCSPHPPPPCPTLLWDASGTVLLRCQRQHLLSVLWATQAFLSWLPVTDGSNLFVRALLGDYQLIPF
jgi:hypothetical protein